MEAFREWIRSQRSTNKPSTAVGSRQKGPCFLHPLYLATDSWWCVRLMHVDDEGSSVSSLVTMLLLSFPWLSETAEWTWLDFLDGGCTVVAHSKPRFPAPSSKLCQNWLRHWRGTFYLRTAVQRCQRPPKGLDTSKIVKKKKKKKKTCRSTHLKIEARPPQVKKEEEKKKKKEMFCLNSDDFGLCWSKQRGRLKRNR